MKKIVLLLLVFSAIVGCQPSPEQMNSFLSSTVAAISTPTPYPTYTPFPTLTAFPTYTVVATYTPFSTYTPLPTYTKVPTQKPKVIVVTATSSPTPLYTPTETLPPTATMSPLQTEKSPGFYLVGVDIAPGLWRSQGSGDSCYWSVTTKQDDIINNHYGMAGVTMFIPASGFQVELGEGCGNWTYLGE